jgi:hypothetical protein
VILGIQTAFYFGGFGGADFFERLYLVSALGPTASLAGSVIGVIIALLSIWAIAVVACAFTAALVYLAVHRSFPTPHD